MSQRLKIAFIVTLVLVNVGLVFLVREKVLDARAEAAKATPTVAPTTSATSAAPTPEPTAAPGGRQSLTVAPDDAIFRIHGGSCDGSDGAAVTVSTDNGASMFTGKDQRGDAVFATTPGIEATPNNVTVTSACD